MRDTELFNCRYKIITDDLCVGETLIIRKGGSVIDCDDIEADGFSQSVDVDRHMTTAQQDQSVDLGEFADISLIFRGQNQIGALSPIQCCEQFLPYSCFHIITAPIVPVFADEINR